MPMEQENILCCTAMNFMHCSSTAACEFHIKLYQIRSGDAPAHP
jgi:hypothetical protein